MGAVSGILGLGGGAAGSGFSAPEAVPIQAPTTNEQAQDAYKRALLGLDQQQAFLQATQAQNGLQNQSNVYNQLQNVASGQGPNPAKAMLANATGANTANQAALMAGQRGSSANPALIARQAAMQGSANQQNAAGQAAQLQAEQSLNAIGAAGNLATQQAAQQANATGAYNQAQQNEQQMLLNAIAQQNNSRVGQQAGINTANAGLVSSNMGLQGKIIGGLMNSAGAAAGAPMADGGPVEPSYKGMSSFGSFLSGRSQPQPQMAKGGEVPAMVSPGEQYLDKQDVKKVAKGANPLQVGERIPGKPKVKGNSYANDTVPKTLEAGGVVIPNSVMQSKNPSKEAEKFVAAIMAKKGNSLPKKGK